MLCYQRRYCQEIQEKMSYNQRRYHQKSQENMSYHRRRYRQESYGYGAAKNTRPRLPPRVPNETGSSWKPLPVWERRFCEEVGAMPWRRFLQAKSNLYHTDKVYDWNDSAAKQAFDDAKQRFWEEYRGVPHKKRLPSADLYIDKDIDWNPKIDAVLFKEVKALSDEEEDKKEAAKAIDWFSIPLDQIKATGWDDDCCNGPRLPILVGWIE